MRADRTAGTRPGARHLRAWPPTMPRGLIARGADPNRPNDKGQTPLARAVFEGETEVVRVLLAGGAVPRAGRPSAIDTARMFGRDDLVALVEQTDDG
jgi:hypothetical protein